MRVYMWEERDECKFTIENKKELKKTLKQLRMPATNLRNYWI